jgi:hypothetical protein
VEGVQLINNGTLLICNACKQAKLMHKPIQKEHEALLAGAFGTEVYADLWGPSPVPLLGGRRYNVMFTDDYSCFTCLTLLCTKDKTFNTYKAFAAWTDMQCGIKIKCLHTDQGGEFLSREFTGFLCKQGTEQCLMMHDTPQHNGVAETLNCCLLEHVHALIKQVGLLTTLWGKALHFTVWVKNHMLMHVLGNATTLYEQLTGWKPSIAGIPEWGQHIWVHNNSGSKLDMCATIAQWVGYDEESMHAHRVYWEDKGKISMERNIKFITDTLVSFPLHIPMTAPIPALPANAAQIEAPPSNILQAMPVVCTPSSIYMMSQAPPATSSGEEKMEDEEEDSLPTPPLTHKGKARPAIERAQQLTCACKPLAHLK